MEVIGLISSGIGRRLELLIEGAIVVSWNGSHHVMENGDSLQTRQTLDGHNSAQTQYNFATLFPLL